jgi:hypothetical protein
MKQNLIRAKGQIRRGQLLNIYGPGSMLDLPDDSVLMPGLAHWTKNRTIIE